MLRVRFAASLAAALLYVAAALAAEGGPPPNPSAPSGKEVAADFVQSALEAEARSDLAGRRELLGQALEADPNNSKVHWQLGHVWYLDKWVSIDEAAAEAGRDKVLADYREMRSRFGDSAEAQRALARWCQKSELQNSARAHATRLHQMQPEDAEALQILGLSWYKGLLLTPEQIARQKTHDEKAKEALRHWQPLVAEIRRQINSKDEKQNAAGWKALRAIRDPSAIEALELAFSKNKHDASLEVVKVIGAMNTPAATDSLLRHALLSKWEDVRLAACEQLRGQSPAGYVPRLIEALGSPAETRFEVARDGDQVRFREIVQREKATGKEQQVVETRVPLFIPNPNLASIVNTAALDAFAHAQTTASEVRGDKRANRRMTEMNKDIYWVLERTTGNTLPHQPDAWYGWWRSSNYMAVNPKPTSTQTYTQYVDVPYVPYIPPSIPIYAGGPVSSKAPPPPAPRHHSCFALGTKVWAITGPVAIEKIEVGDQVLAQDPFSGELTYKPVLETTVGHTDLVSIDLGAEKIEATPGHVFWVSGKGWRMATDLKTGDRLHSVEGWAEVIDVKSIAAADTRNLIVADYGTYFVGDSRLLVHDVTMLQPYAGKVPGDKPSEELAAQ